MDAPWVVSLNAAKGDTPQHVTAPKAKALGLLSVPPHTHPVTIEVFGDLVAEY